MRNHSNNEGTVAKRKFMSVCPFGLIEFYCDDIIDCKLCNMLQLKLDRLKVKVKITESRKLHENVFFVNIRVDFAIIDP